MGHSYVGVEHLFLAMIRDRSAVPTQVLARSMDLDQVEASLLEVLASPEYNGAPPADAVVVPVERAVRTAGRAAALRFAGGGVRVQRRG
jgi:hypothetical protein